jgi:thioredoxin reductase (NADPH)
MALFEAMPGIEARSVPDGAYMRLSPEQLASATKYGIPRTYSSTTLLYRQGEREADLYIVMTGSLETFWKDAAHREEHSITLEAGEFSGELNLLNQRETLIAARALSGSSLL